MTHISANRNRLQKESWNCCDLIHFVSVWSTPSFSVHIIALGYSLCERRANETLVFGHFELRRDQ